MGSRSDGTGMKNSRSGSAQCPVLCPYAIARISPSWIVEVRLWATRPTSMYPKSRMGKRVSGSPWSKTHSSWFQEDCRYGFEPLKNVSSVPAERPLYRVSIHIEPGGGWGASELQIAI